MKNNKALIIICVILLNILVVFMVGQAFFGKESDYDKTLRQARTYTEQNLCRKALEYYEEALNYEDSLDVRIEMIQVYEKAIENGEFKNAYTVFSKVKEVVELYPKDARAYEAVCGFFEKYEQFEDCAEYLLQAKDRKITSEGLAEILERVRYLYKVNFTMYSDVSSQYNGGYLVRIDDAYALINTELSRIVSDNFSYASSFSEGYAFVRKGNVDEEYLSYVVDKSDIRQCYLEGVTESSGIGKGTNAEGETILLLAGKTGDRYKYYGLNGQILFGDYLFAGRFRNNVAAVQESENGWRLINAQGQPIMDTVFEDVILNEFGECAPKGRIFAKVDGKYHLYDMTGKQIGDFACDDAHAFIEDVTAFKDGESWGYVDSLGNVVIEPLFEEAKAFSKGIAGVKKDGLWSFVDLTGKTVIEGNFEEAGYMGSNGNCFVKMNGRWATLEMYYYVD